MTTGSATSWAPEADGPVLALAVAGSTVYAGGSFTSIGGRTRNTIDRSGYFFKILSNVWSNLCPVAGTPLVPLDVPGLDDGGPFVDFANVRNNPAVSGQPSIHFGLGKGDRVELRVHDVAGRLVRTLADRQFPPGTHDLVWDGLDGHGRHAARGVYLARIRFRNSGFHDAVKITILR